MLMPGPILDRINPSALYISEESNFSLMYQAKRFRYSLRMANLFQTVEILIKLLFCGVWSGSALFVSYPFGGLQTKTG